MKPTTLLKLTILILILAAFNGQHIANASTAFSGLITSDTTWTLADSPYIVNFLGINAGTTLTIEPGVIVKLGGSTTIDVNGTLYAQGTLDQKIYFTSQKDDTVGGDDNADGGLTTPVAQDWRNIKFFSGSSGDLSNVVIRYAGSNFFYGSGGIFNNGGDVSVTDSSITSNDVGILQMAGTINVASSDIGNQSIGIYAWNGGVNVDGSNIHDNLQNGIFVHPQSSSLELSLTNNNFSDNTLMTTLMPSTNFIHSGNTATGNGVNGWVIGGTVSVDHTWTAGDLPYVVDAITVNSGATLTLDPGVVIKFNTQNSNNSHIDVEGGTLVATGTAEDKIYFTALSDDTVGGDTNGDGSSTTPAPGDWRNIKFNSGVGTLSNFVLKYAGYSTYLGNVGLYNNGGNLTLSNATFIDNTQTAFFQWAGSTTITNSEFSNSAYGIVVFQGTLDITGSSIKNNSELGVVSNGSGTVNAQNNYWGDPSGPYNLNTNPSGLGNGVSLNVNYIPWLGNDPFGITPPPTCTVDCFSNVLFLPGIEASRLYKTRTDGSEDQLWEPNNNLDVENLYLNSSGISIDPNIYTKDIIKETNTPIPTGSAGFNMYKSFSNNMDQLVSDQKIKKWKSYAYDWRQSVDDIVNNGTKYQDGTVSLIDTLQSLVGAESKNGKVTIVAHSNGGLLAKALLKKLQEDKITGTNNLIDSVDVLILVAVPEIGTAKAVPAILHGYDQSILGGFLMDETHARELGRNMISAFGLLPSKEYINRVSASPVTFVDNFIPSWATTKLVQTFGSAISSYTEYKDFLFGNEGRINPTPTQTNLPISLSQDLFSQAESLHDDIDVWVPPSSLRVIEVAGWGLDTVASYEYYPICESSTTLGCTFTMDEKPRFTSDGDGTVVASSAQYMSFLGNAEKYWMNLFKYNAERFISGRVINRNHADILEAGPVLDFISSIIENNNQIDPTYFSNTNPIDPKNRFRISIHSPVTIDAYDLEGNHTGKVCPPNSDFCYKEENVINSSYLEFGEGKYINLPEDQMSKIKLQGTDVGTFTYESEKVLPNGTSTTSSFVDIPVTTQTQAEVTLNQAGTPQLALDVTGDGVTDLTINPSATFDPILFLQVMKKTVESFDISKQQKNTLLNRIDDTIKAIQKGKISKAKQKIEQFKKILAIHQKEKQKDKLERERKNEQDHEREHKENKKPKQLSSTDIQTLLTLLNQLLDNLK